MVSVTIGLPVYNGAAYLDKALASLCTQTFTDLKILVSDNASTDETGEITKKWAAYDKRIEYHRQPQNIGASENFQWVLNNTDSRWFCFAAHDDLWSPGFIEELFNAITEKSNIVLSAPRMETLFEDGRPDKIFPFVGKVKSGNTRLSYIVTALKYARSGWIYGLFDRVALVSFFKQTQTFRHVWGSDYIVILAAILAGTVTGSDKAIYYKRQTPLSDERYRPKTAKDQFILYRDIWQEFFRQLQTTSLCTQEKIFLLPPLFRYARQIQKPKRIFSALIKGRWV